MHRVLAFVVIAAAALSPTARAAPRILGFDSSGEVYFVDANARVLVCRVDGNDVPVSWPKGVEVGPGAACATLGEKDTLTAAQKTVKQALSAKAAAATSPMGLTLRVDVKNAAKEGVATLVVADANDEFGRPRVILVPVKGLDGVVLDAPSVQLTGTLWRADGRFAAALLQDKAGHLAVTGTLVDTLLQGGNAGKKLALRKIDDAGKEMRKRAFTTAARIFDEALAADPDSVAAHYGRATADAQSGTGRTAMVDNLAWLKERAAKDPAAKRALERARTDDAFDAWVGETDVRELIGLPKIADLDLVARLTERAAVWTKQGASCKAPWVTLVFKKNGQLQLTQAESCKGKKTQATSAGAWKPSSPTELAFEIKKPPPGCVLPARGTAALSGSQQSFTVGSGDAAFVFEPGVAHLDDSVL